MKIPSPTHSTHRPGPDSKGSTRKGDPEETLNTRLREHVERNHGGDYRAAFDAFDRNRDSYVDRDELRGALETIGVGNRLTRGRWVNGIMSRADRDHDNRLSWPELQELASP